MPPLLPHPASYPGADLVPHDFMAIITDPALVSDICLGDFGTDYFVKYCPSSRLGDRFQGGISERSGGASASRLGFV